MAGDRRVLQADEALADIHTSLPILQGTFDVVDSYPAVGPLHRTYSAVDTFPHPVSSQDGQDNLARWESEAAAGVGPVAAAGAEEVVAAVGEVAVIAAVGGLHRRRTVWYAMLLPVGQYR